MSSKNNLGTKIILKKLFIKYFSKDLILPKQGFSGFPNESIKKLGKYKNFRLNKILQRGKKHNLEKISKNREVNWKIINLEHFLRIHSHEN